MQIRKFLRDGVNTLKRDRFNSAVNIIGLSLGIFCLLITSLYVRDELTYDKWHKNAERILLPTISMESSGGMVYTSPPFALHDALLNESPGVEEVVNIGKAVTADFESINQYQIGENQFDADAIYFTEPSFFRVFDFSLKFGDEQSALNEPKNVVISAEIAEKHFGKDNPVGKFIELKHIGAMKVSGVLDPIPGNSHLRFDMLLAVNMNADPYKSYKGNWQLGYGQNYFLIEKGYSKARLIDDFKSVYEKNRDTGESRVLGFDSFGELYLNGKVRGTQSIFGGNRKYVLIFSVVGGLLFLVACFNYVNLKVASSFARTKDIAVRKVLGSSRARLILLLVGETTLVTIISLIISLIALEFSLPYFNELLGKRLDLSFIDQPGLLFLPTATLVLVIAISGIYPALISSSFNMASLLKGELPKVSKPMLRKSLVAFQFVICAGLLSSALIIRGQAKFLINKDLGYNTQNVHNIGIYENGFGGKYQELKTELERIPQIEAVSGSPLPRSIMATMVPLEQNGEEVMTYFNIGSVDLGFDDLLEIDILKGNSFTELPSSRLKNAVLINETAYKAIGLEDPIGIKLSGRYEVVGVMKDFHVSSVKSKIRPLMVTADPANIRNLHFKFREGEKETVMAEVEKVWERFGTDKAFQTTELATFYANAFKREDTLTRIFDGLTVMLVVISFFGLFSLSVFESRFRERELGIRKVLGASYLSLIKLANRKFLGLVFLALFISAPITYLLISNWLEAFPYRLESTASYFFIASLTVLALAVFVLTVHGHKNALKNPVDALRTE